MRGGSTWTTLWLITRGVRPRNKSGFDNLKIHGE
jgi:hypothetical protein